MINKFLLSTSEAEVVATGGGSLYTWGWAANSVLGDGNTTTGRYVSTPTKIDTLKWLKVSNGTPTAGGYDDRHMLAIRSDGLLFAWGFGEDGALGYDEPTSWSKVSFGSSHAIAIRSDGLLFGWGSNGNGQIGDGTTLGRASPVQIGSSTWTDIAAGEGHSLAIRSDGLLFAWGLNSGGSYGRPGSLGDGTTINKSLPVQIGSSSWTKVASAGTTSYAIDITGALYSWGNNADGMMGVPHDDPQSWIKLAVGNTGTSSAAFGIRSDGLLFAWGTNSGRLGDDTTVAKSSPVQIGSSSWTMITSGPGGHSMAIRSDGLLFGWGGNTNGGLGDGTTVAKSSPVQIGSSSWAQVSAGVLYTMAIRSDGLLFGWGLNTGYQLGDGTTVNKSSPVQIGSSSWTQVSAGTSHTMAIRSDGLLFAWGTNTSGRLGDNTAVNKSSPVQIGTGFSWTQVATSASHTVAVRADGLLFAWGSNSTGQLGDGTTVAKSSPVQIGSSSWTQVSAGASYTVAVKSDGLLFAWGLNTGCQLGDGTTVNKSSPVQIGSSSWTQVFAGTVFTAGITINNEYYTWGQGTLAHGDLGRINQSAGIGNLIRNRPTKLYAYKSQSSPVKIGTSSWTQVTAGADVYNQGTALGITTDKKLFGWGIGLNGVLADSTYDTTVGFRYFNPEPIAIGSSSWTQVSIGQVHVMAIRSDGLLFGWGKNLNGAIGDGTTANKSSPVQIGTSSWFQVTTGGGGAGAPSAANTLAIRSDGLLFAWGENGNGNFGDGTITNKSSPIQIGTSSWTFVTASNNYYDNSTFGITSTGALFGWGSSDYGRLGNGVPVATSSISVSFPTKLSVFLSRVSPIQVGTSSWTQISAGYGYSMAIRSDGLLFAWGTNTSGRLGDGTTITRVSPIQIGTSSWTQVSAGKTANTSAISSNGLLFSWGANAVGQLGDGTTVNKSSPVQIGSSSWTQVSVGVSHSIAIRSDGLLFSWGSGTLGKLGDGSTINKSSPVLIGAGFSWTQVDAGASHSMAITSDGLLFGWGSNNAYQLGDGTTTPKSTPVQIGIGFSWTKVSVGFAPYTMAIRSDGLLFGWGSSGAYQIGDGNLSGSKAVPYQIGTSSWTQVSAGYSATAAISVT
jgi:alpha-tubulin suppressor-like RCC1 family protein